MTADDQKKVALRDEANGQGALPFRLTGSQAKTAFALRQNVETMINGRSPKKLVEVEYPRGDTTEKMKVYVSKNPENLHCVGFLTLTVGDYEHGPVEPGKQRRFIQVWDAKEASRRINNLNRRVLSGLFEKAVIVTERHKSEAIHFHIVGILAGRPDIRSGFNFDAVRNGNYVSVSDELRGLWQRLREVLPEYGFGRAQLTPIEKTGEAIACYVSKYVEKNICNRLKSDYRKKLVRYIGWHKGQLKPNEFAWGSKRAVAWRCKARQLAALVNIYEPEQAAATLGPRWAWHITELIRKVSEKPVPFMIWDFPQKEICRSELAKIAGQREVKRLHDLQKYRVQFGDEILTRAEWKEFEAEMEATMPDPIEQCYKCNFGFKDRLEKILKKTAPPFWSGPHSGKITKIRVFGYSRHYRSPRVKTKAAALQAN